MSSHRDENKSNNRAGELNRRSFLKTGSVLGAGLAIAGSGVTDTCSADDKNCTEAMFDLINKRRSIREFKSTPIPDDHINKIIGAARMSPTAGNQQPWKFLVVRDPARIKAMEQACYQSACDYWSQRDMSEKDYKQKQEGLLEFYQTCFSAPVYIVVLTDNESKWPSYNHWDGSLAAGTLILAATALGYGTVFYTDSISTEITKTVLNIPDRYTRICITPIGVPVEWPKTPEKKKLEEIIVYDSM